MVTHDEHAQVEDLRRRLEEAEEALRAIRTGEIDALVVEGPDGPRIYTLQGADRSYRTMIEAMHQGAASLSTEGTILYCNRSLARLVSRPPEKILGTRFTDLLPASELSSFQSTLQRARTTGSSIELHVAGPDGQTRPVLLAMSPVAMPDALVICLIATDLTEQIEHQNVQEANRAKDMFLATLSHELRTPLSAIMGWVSLLGRPECTPEDLREGLEVIERNSRIQAQLIADVLDVSRIVSGKLRLDVGPCDLVEIVHAAMDVVRPAAAAKRIRIETRLDSSLSGLAGDPNRLQQVAWNLLSNAVKFTPEGGTVRVRLSREPLVARLEVSDTGGGISPDFLPHVFDRFRQADSTTRRRAGGLGLGLSIVKQLVELHGGTVEAWSDGEGRGSTFVVRIPLASQIAGDAAGAAHEAPQSPQPTSAKPMRLDGLRILVVDDEDDARRLIAKVLRDAGAAITAVRTVPEALRAVEQFEPHVLVSDIAMPDEDGHDLIRQVRGKGHTGSTLPAVALTAFADKGYAMTAVLAGFQVHVPKPVDPDELVAVVGGLAGRTGA